MRLIAHRGFAGVYPENTLGAMEAATLHADAVEIDVRRCGSGELVAIHDERVDRVTDGTGRVSEHTLADLRSLDVLGSGEGVPTLEAVLGVIPPEIGANVELKEAGTVGDALSIASGADPTITISSFSPAILAEARDVDPRVPRALVVEDEPDEYLSRAHDLDCTFFHPGTDLCDGNLVSRAHRAGMGVNTWTVKDHATARRLAELGVDGIIADRWDVVPDADRESTS